MERPVIAQQRQGHHDAGKPPPAPRVCHRLHVLGELRDIQERRHRSPFLRFLVDHHRGAHAAIRVAAAVQLAPLRVLSLHVVGKIAERAHQGNGEPVACRLDLPHLLAHVLGQVRECIALLQPPLGGDILIAPGEAYRLEAHERNLLRVFHRELHDGAHLVVIQVVDDGGHQHDFHARFVQVVDGPQLHVEQVAHLAVAVGVVADAVELEIDVAQPGLERLLAEFLALRELDAVGGCLHAVVAHFARVAHRVAEARMQRGLAAGKLHAHLPLGLDGNRVVQNLGDVFPAQLMDVAHLVGVHEAWVAHHVAAVGQVHGEHGAPSIADGAGPVIVQRGIGVRGDVPAREILLDPGKKIRIHGHHVLVPAVDGAFLHHPHLAVALNDVRLDLSYLFVQQVAPVLLAGENLVARFLDAIRAQRIRLPRPAQRGLGLLPRLQHGLIGPLRRDRWLGIFLDEILYGLEGRTRGLGYQVVGHLQHT